MKFPPIKEYIVFAWDYNEAESWEGQYKASFDTLEEATHYARIIVQDYSYDRTQVVRHSDFSIALNLEK